MRRLVWMCAVLLLAGCPMGAEDQEIEPRAVVPVPVTADPDNACRFAFDDECDDGRPGASTSFCDIFTDEADCLKTTADNPDNPVPEVVEVPVPGAPPRTNLQVLHEVWCPLHTEIEVLQAFSAMLDDWAAGITFTEHLDEISEQCVGVGFFACQECWQAIAIVVHFEYVPSR